MTRLTDLILILGPTACGKTALSLDVAERFQGEILSGDSMQVYRRMDIGTAKIRPAEMRGIPHHLLDIREPEEAFSVAEFRTEATRAIEEIASRGQLSIVVGGSGLYLDSLLRPLHLAADTASDPAVRAQLKQSLAEQGNVALHTRLAAVDSEAAARIHPNDAHRLLRALEVWETTGKPISCWQRENEAPSAYRTVKIGLTMARAELYRRIEARVDAMLAAGLVAEVRALLAEGVPRDAVSMQGLGYRQIAAALAGECSLEEAGSLIKRDTRRFAKRQLTWFRRDAEIQWFDISHYRERAELSAAVYALICRRLEEGDYEAAGTTGSVSECDPHRTDPRNVLSCQRVSDEGDPAGV